jgi:thymidylate kinase
LPAAEDIHARTQVFSRPMVRIAWFSVALFDSFFEYVIKTRCLLTLGKTVVFDRYLEDARLDLEIKFPEFKRAASNATRWIGLLAPRPDACFLLLSSWETAVARSELKKEPFPDPPKIRRMRLEAYELMARSGLFQVIDASAPAEEIHSQIMDFVADHGRSSG